ncbi:MAG: alpha/beta fold hydrolase [Dehalococcoidia bacterium]
MDYLAVVSFLHLGPAHSSFRSVSAASVSYLVLVAVACGGGDGNGDVTPTTDVQETATATATPIVATPVITPTPTAEASPTATPAAIPTSTAIVRDPSIPTSTDVGWSNGDVFVGGTFTVPELDPGVIRAPTVLLIADGGGADRDWLSTSIPGISGSGRLLASALTDAGYITLRYDRRGTGRRIGETTPADGENRLSDSVDEVSSALQFLKSRPEVDPERIYVVAHDEGALHVLLREAQVVDSGLAGIALLAPSALTLRQQVIRRLGELTLQPEDELTLASFDAAMALFIEDALPEGDLGLSPSMQGLFENLTHPSRLPYNIEIWNLDVVSLLPEAAPPLLVLIGQSDTEVDWSLEGQMWGEAASDGQDVEFVYPQNADHVLKSTSPDAVETGFSTYNTFGRTLDAEGSTALIDWLNRHSGL